MKNKGIVKKETKPPSLTVHMIIYVGKSKESVISILEHWDNLTIFLVTELKIAAFLNTKKCTFIKYIKNIQQKNRMKCQIPRTWTKIFKAFTEKMINFVFYWKILK